MYLISLLLLKQNYERLLYQINENAIAQSFWKLNRAC